MNIGPTYENFQHGPILPAPGELVTVSVEAEDPDGVASVTLYWKPDKGSWTTVAMTTDGSGLYSGKIPGHSSGKVIQFYVSGVDTEGALSTYPAAGAESRALYKVDDGKGPGNRPMDTFRMVMLDADNDSLFRPINSNEMSNDFAGGTIIHTGSFGAKAFYDIDIRQIGSRYIRPNSGYKVNLNPDDKVYGVHSSIRFDTDLLFELYM